ncbi:hypothetical protein [Kangiella sp.]|uniref:hypothetical protein n=1 Tax=Kangiella sp. TaxID=1920245 RepID=UPI003A8DFE46
MLNEADSNGVTLQERLLRDIHSNIPNLQELTIDYEGLHDIAPQSQVADLMPEVSAVSLNLILYITNYIFITYQKELVDRIENTNAYKAFKKVGLTDKEIISTVVCINIAISYIHKERYQIIEKIKELDTKFTCNLNLSNKAPKEEHLFFDNTQEIIAYISLWSSVHLLRIKTLFLKLKAKLRGNNFELARNFFGELTVSELSVLSLFEQGNIAEKLLLVNNTVSLDYLKRVLKKDPIVKYKHIKVTLDTKHTRMLRIIANKYDINAQRNTAQLNIAGLVLGNELVSPIGLLSEVCESHFFFKQLISFLESLDIQPEEQYDMFDKVSYVVNHYNFNSIKAFKELVQDLII